MPLAGLIRAQTCDGPAGQQVSEPCAPNSSANHSRKPGWWTHHPSATLIVVPSYWLNRESFHTRPLGSTSPGNLTDSQAAAIPKGSRRRISPLPPSGCHVGPPSPIATLLTKSVGAPSERS